MFLFLAAMLALSSASLQMLGIVPIYERLKPILLAEPEVQADRAASSGSSTAARRIRAALTRRSCIGALTGVGGAPRRPARR